jgi:translation initiation factor IF-1
MVKNTIGGSKHKGMARKMISGRGGSRLRKLAEEGELYAVVIKILGGPRCLVVGMDNVERDCIIRGKFRGNKKRDNTLRGGVLVLVGDREWSSATSSGKNPVCDLLEVYSDIDKDRLKTTETSIDWKFLSLDAIKTTIVAETDDITFTDDHADEEYQRRVEEEIDHAKDLVVMDFGHDDEVDLDDI